VDLSAADVSPQVVRAYLSRQHFEDVENSCLMVALPSDVSRSKESAKRALETVFQAIGQRLGAQLDWRWPPPTYYCPGNRRLVRGRHGGSASDGQPPGCGRVACMAVALKLGGWDRSGRSKRAKSDSPRPRRGRYPDRKHRAAGPLPQPMRSPIAE
jgi:hypothetical protein